MKDNALRLDSSGSIGPFVAGGFEPRRGQPIVLLVHGYNNDQAEAGDSYFAMRSNLDYLLRTCGIDKTVRQDVQSHIWELYWPGYMPLSHRGPSGLKRKFYEPVMSAPSYSLEVIKARGWVADRLSSYLNRIGPIEVFFIAHSLGCRVVLEVLERLLPSMISLMRCSGYLLMAGAVPIDQLMPSGRLRHTAALPPNRFCLHSWHDAVLLGAFPPGQILSGEIPIYGLPVATGLTGWPAAMWSDHVGTSLSHGGYWSESLFRDNSISSQLCAAIFGLATPKGTALSRLLYRPSAQALSILPERFIPSAQLRGENWLKQLYGP
jgi:pimeloyl-ACP methyl ester carboxylesterase